MKIHTVGDSHCAAGWAGVTTHIIGALLCYSFGIEKLQRIDIRDFDIEDGDTIIFCLGEIDCRCHIHKYVNESVKYEDIIDDIVENYFEAIQLNIDVCNIKLKNICIYNVVPPIEKHNTQEYIEYPFLGRDDERKKYVLYFNKKLKEKCFQKKYIFFDIYDKYTDKNGFLNKDLSDSNVHIHDATHIIDFINRNLSLST
jgi:hypothetical protein